jgi:arsenate reductase
MSETINLLFLCTGNSCRSQMAEGWARALGSGLVRVRSAGIEAHGRNPRAIKAMNEAGVDIGGQESQRLTPADLEWADLVVTVCGHADEHCPVLPPHLAKRHWPLDDPALASGTDDEIAQVFRACRDDIRERVTTLLDEVRAGTIDSARARA